MNIRAFIASASGLYRSIFRVGAIGLMGIVATSIAAAQYQTYPDADWILGGSTSPASAVMFARDPRYAISAHQDGSIRVWDTRTRYMIRILARDSVPILAADISTQLNLLALSFGDGRIELRDATTGEYRGSLQQHDAAVRALRFSRDGRLLVSGGDDLKVILWNVERRDTVEVLAGPKSAVTSVDIAPDNSRIAAGGADFVTRIWSVSSRIQEHEVYWAQRRVGAVTFSNDGSVLAVIADMVSPNFDQPTGGRLVDANSGEIIAGFWTCTCHSARFTPDGKYLMFGCEHLLGLGVGPFVYRYEFDRLQTIRDYEGGATYFPSLDYPGTTTIAISPDSKTVLLGGSANQVFLDSVDVLSGSDRMLLSAHHSPVGAVAASPDDASTYSGTTGGDLFEWSNDSAWRSGLFWKSGPEVRGISLSPDGRTMATCAMDGSIKLWDVTRHALMRTLYASADNSVNQAAWSPDGLHIAGAIGPMDSTAVVFDTASVAPQLRLTGHSGGLWSIAWTPDGTTIATAGDDGTVRFWNDSSGVSIAVATGHVGRVTSIAISPDGRTLASASVDQTVRLWSVPSGDPIGVLRGHAGPVNGVAFTPDGSHVVSAGEDATIRVWDVGSRTETYRYDRFPYPTTSLAITPDGRHIIAGCEDGSVVMWKYRTVAGFSIASHAGLNAVVPNPFRDRTSMSFVVQRAGRVSVALYDLNGRMVERVFDGQMTAGAHSVEISGLSAGAYVYRVLSAGSVVGGVIVCQ